MDGSTALNVTIALAALLLFAAPLAAPAESPPDRVLYEVEPTDIEPGTWDENRSGQWERYAYEEFTDEQRAVFDAARDSAPEPYIRSPPDEAPESLTPAPGGIENYYVQDGDTYYLLQAIYESSDLDPVADVAPRIGSFVVGIVLGAGAVYRQFM